MGILLADEVVVAFTNNVTIFNFVFGDDHEQFISIKMSDAVRIAKYILEQAEPMALARTEH